eukprot:scaffold20587_cov110-Isochrysis_galbana.AAC.4
MSIAARSLAQHCVDERKAGCRAPVRRKCERVDGNFFGVHAHCVDKEDTCRARRSTCGGCQLRHRVRQHAPLDRLPRAVAEARIHPPVPLDAQVNRGPPAA